MTTKRTYDTNNGQPIKLRWLPLANRGVFLRAMIVAVVIGSILTLANQSGWIAGNEPPQVLQLILVFLLPFAVVTVAQVAELRQAHIDSIEHVACGNPESVIETVVSHGILARAVAIGLFFGSVNAVLTLSNATLISGDLAAVSVVPLAQAYALPFLFGLLSQAISYRRARYQAVNN